MNSAQALGPSAAQKLGQHRLGLVVSGVAHHDPLRQGSIASGPGTRFQVGPGRHRHRHRLAPYAQRLCRRPDHHGVIATCQPEPVIDVYGQGLAAGRHG